MFRYKTGVALNVVDWFSILEIELQAAGWILVSGGGSTTIVYRSVGELGTFTKLFIRIRRDAVLDKVYFRVQDDGAGTHVTTEFSPLDFPGAGDVPVSYWMSINKDAVALVVLDGVAYTGAYVGDVMPFSLVIGDECYRRCAFAMQATATKILRSYTGAYDAWVSNRTAWAGAYGFGPSALDGSRAIFSTLVRNNADNQEIYGQPHLTIGLNYNASMGMSSQDTVTTGFPGATSSWIVFVTGNNFFGLLTNGIKPTGRIEEAGFYYQAYAFANQAAIQTALETFFTAKGYTNVAWYAPAYPDWDRYVTSTGESGIETIRFRIGRSAASGSFEFDVVDKNSIGFHNSAVLLALPAVEFPMNGEIFGDKDVIGVGVYHAGVYEIIVAGKMPSFYPDESIIPFEYKLGAFRLSGDALSKRRLRTDAGGWDSVVNEYAEVYATSSPNRVDGATYVTWPLFYHDNLSNNKPFGIVKYIRRVSSVALAMGDTVNVGAKTFKYFATDLALRIV